MPEDSFGTLGGGLSAPATRSFTITPHATDELARVTRAIFVGSAGNLTVRFAGDAADRTLTGLLAGAVYPFRLSAVRVAGTTAGALVGLD
jgi:hypothetical protein